MGSQMHRLEAWGLIVGPTTALLFFLLEPGALVIDPAEFGDADATVRALASNAAIAHTSALVVPLGLVLMLYGLNGINRTIGGDSMAAALSRLGHPLHDGGRVRLDPRIRAGPRHRRDGSGLRAGGGAGRSRCTTWTRPSRSSRRWRVAAGFLGLNLGLWALFPSGTRKVVALAVAAISVVCLVSLIIGHNLSEPGLITVSRACYFPWVAWTAALGVGFLQGRDLE